MDIKKKRLVTILIVLGLALLFPVIMSIVGLKVKMPGGGTNIFFWIYVPSMYAVAFIKRFSDFPPLLYLVAWTTYIATYLLLGWIIARLIYPNKKTSDKAETPQD